MQSLIPNPSRLAGAVHPLSLRKRAAFTLMELLVVLVILAAVAALVVSKVDHVRGEAEITAARATMQTLREALMGSPAGPGYLADMKHVPGFYRLQIRVHDLFHPDSYPAAHHYDPVARRGWRGPYLQNPQGVANTNSARGGRFPAAGEQRFTGDRSFGERTFFFDSASSYYGQTGDFTAADPWGNPIVIQVPPAEAFSGGDVANKRFRFTRLVSAGPDGVLDTPRDRLGGWPSNETNPRGDDLVLFLERADTNEDEEP